MREDSRSARRNFPIFADKFPAIPGRLFAGIPAFCRKIPDHLLQNNSNFPSKFRENLAQTSDRIRGPTV